MDISVGKNGNSVPFFSVIIPIYNVEKYLSKCVDSILCQSFTDFEVILVDDGSPDTCPVICDNYAVNDSRVKVIHKENGGLVSARKKGAEASKGLYIVTVDGDDWISGDYFSDTYNIIKKYNVDLIQYGTVLAFDDKEVISMPGLEEGCYEKSDIEKHIFPQLISNSSGRYFPPAIWSKVIKRDLYVQNQLRVDDKIKIGEDQACVRPIIYAANSLYISHKCYYHYRQNPESMTKKKKPFDCNGPRLIGTLFEESIDVNRLDFQQQIYRFVIHNLFNICCSQFFSDLSFRETKKKILEILADPYYQRAIKGCRYDSSYIKGQLSLKCLKHKNCALMWLYSKCK